jgi:hypothetical protein
MYNKVAFRQFLFGRRCTQHGKVLKDSSINFGVVHIKRIQQLSAITEKD